MTGHGRRHFPTICILLAGLAVSLLAVPAVSAQTTRSTDTYKGFNLWWGWEVDGSTWTPESCNRQTQMTIYEPANPGRYPVLVYAHGTTSESGNLLTGEIVARTAAEHGFVGVAPRYEDSWNTAAYDSQAKCIFRSDKVTSAVEKACARVKAACSLGVVTMGHSEGGAIAARAANWSGKVRASAPLGVNGPDIPEARDTPDGTRRLPDDRIRATTGQEDLAGGTRAGINAVTGQSCSTTQFDCLDADGSGYYIVRHAEVVDGRADHCFMEMGGCKLNVSGADPNWLSPSTKWGLPAALKWLKRFTG